MIETSSTIRPARQRGFTLVELLVVIGIIALLISILLPSLNKAKRAASKAVCMSNLKQVFFGMQMYSTDSRGWIFPVSKNSASGRPTNLGGNVSPDRRWPVLVRAFNIKVPSDPVTFVSPLGTFDSNAYPAGFTTELQKEERATAFDAKPYTPKILLCPEDLEPLEAHSYVLNMHVADERIRFGTIRLGTAHSSSNVIVAGEKKTTEADYFMNSDPKADKDHDANPHEFARVVEPYRHGLKLGSNYLFMDGHVDNRMPAAAAGQLDPWDVETTKSETQTASAN